MPFEAAKSEAETQSNATQRIVGGSGEGEFIILCEIWTAAKESRRLMKRYKRNSER